MLKGRDLWSVLFVVIEGAIIINNVVPYIFITFYTFKLTFSYITLYSSYSNIVSVKTGVLLPLLHNYENWDRIRQRRGLNLKYFFLGIAF